MDKWFPKKITVYIGTTGADNKTWGKVISKLEKCVNLYNRRDLSFRVKRCLTHCVVQHYLVYRESYINVRNGENFF